MNLKYLNNVLALDNLSQEFKDFKQNVLEKDTLCISLNAGERAHLTAGLNTKTIYVAKDSYSALMAYQKLKTYEESAVLLQPNDDLLFFRKSFQKSLSGDRVKALYAFASNQSKILVTSPLALLQFLPKKKRLLKSVTTIKVNDEIDIYALIDRLIELGYTREEACEEKNTFSSHGDILDVFLSYMTMPIRISFFGDTIENIKTFDVETMLSLGALDEVTLYPNNDLLYEPQEIEKAISMAQKEISKMPLEAAQRANQILSDLASIPNCTQQHQWLIPFISKFNDTIFDYLDDGIMVLDEVDGIKGLLSNHLKEHMARISELYQKGEITKSHVLSIMNEEEMQQRLDGVLKLGFSNLATSATILKPKQIIKINSKRLNNYILHYDKLISDLDLYLRNGLMVVLCQATKDRAKALYNSLIDQDIPCVYKEEELQYKPGIYIVPEDILEGFIYPSAKLIVIGVENIVKNSHQEEKKRNRKSVFVMPQVGDYVVHEFHGIGKCLGLKRMKNLGVEQDYILVEYKNGGLLYVPISQMNKLSRYSGTDTVPKLSSLGGHDFAKLKDSVKKSLAKMAVDLVDLYSKRMNLKGYKYSEDDALMEEFENAFEYTPTIDQVEAIKDIKQDMEKGVIMDRLLCGDVGYGKTEVALRAIFKTILDNKQAAILCPTTVLAQQHYQTASERFRPYGIKIELISRLRSDKEINASLERLKKGESQVVVATHRLLSKDVQFKDLGLLVLDEEQRFGVAHKEKLKVLKNNLNVLTLSATPIPRTLNMSLIGVRDISVLETPPINRIPIQTSVTELTDALIEDTIKREIGRGGQVFILYNEVETIEKFAEEVRELVPEANVIVAHGQMKSDILEEQIRKFYMKEANVLVCTTIIENGIDIPDANTLIVCNADTLGLSQLYQLRGRVGRSNKLAYAYFTVNPNKVLTDSALKRLNAIMDYTELGSGFKIAMRDLEIRGAGNILGKEQHGHIEKVGYDMYCKLLQESIDEIKGIKHSNVTCQMDVLINSYLDKNYVEEENSRLKVLRDILDIYTKQDVENLLKRLKESFGEVPVALENLINVGFAKNLAQELEIEHVLINNAVCELTFANMEFLKNDKLMEAITNNSDKLTLVNDTKAKVRFSFTKMSNADKLRALIEFLLEASA